MYLSHKNTFCIRELLFWTIWKVVSRGFNHGWAPEKLTGCEDDFACLGLPSVYVFFLIKKFS